VLRLLRFPGDSDSANLFDPLSSDGAGAVYTRQNYIGRTGAAANEPIHFFT
jgi:hypothetical protein